jgi:hypothetical protein
VLDVFLSVSAYMEHLRRPSLALRLLLLDFYDALPVM